MNVEVLKDGPVQNVAVGSDTERGPTVGFLWQLH